MRRLRDDWEQRLESALRERAEEGTRLVSELEEARTTQQRLVSRVETLEAVLSYWLLDDADDWLYGDADHGGEDKGEQTAQSRLGNRMGDPMTSIFHDIDRVDVASHVGTACGRHH